MASVKQAVLYNLLGFFILFLIPCCLSDETESTDEYDFDSKPGTQHEFKIEVKAGREECFYQKIKQGAHLYVTFEVLRGADRNVDMVIRMPDGNILDSHLWTSEGNSEREIELGGVHSFCVDNTFSRFSSKLVYFYIVIFVEEDWDKYTKEIEEFDIKIQNFTQSVKSVQLTIHKMRGHQAGLRQRMMRDWHLSHYNGQYIQNWSILMCILIMATSGFQAFFVRRLFTVTNVTPSSKPRA